MTKAMFTVEETAELLRISRATLYARLRSGEVKSVLLGRRRLIPAWVIEEISQRAS